MGSCAIDNSLDNLNGFSKEELLDTLERLREYEKNHSSNDESKFIAVARHRFINQIVKALEEKHCTIDKPYVSKKRGDDWIYLTNKETITKEEWKRLVVKYHNYKLTLKTKKDIAEERKNKLQKFITWFELNKPPKGKRGRPSKKVLSI
jgi:hypothetical protein